MRCRHTRNFAAAPSKKLQKRRRQTFFEMRSTPMHLLDHKQSGHRAGENRQSCVKSVIKAAVARQQIA